jgi:NADH dehydrogenase
VLDDNGKPYPATAQNASRQGPLCADNILSQEAGEPIQEFSYSSAGSFAAIGHRQAAAEVMGLNITGFLGWFIYRSAYLFKMPTIPMKIRLMADWTTSLLFKNEPVQLGVHQKSS